MDATKPCPVCKQPVRVVEMAWPGGPAYYAFCLNDGCSKILKVMLMANDPETANRLWNERKEHNA